MNQVTQTLNTQLKPESNEIEVLGGTDGLTGADGIDAAHYAEVTLYTNPAVSSPPTAPTATFTWFTAVLSSVTAGWSQTPPTIDPTSTNTVYYSKITFNDSTEPFATTTDTGSTPVALYDFTNLSVTEENFTTVLKGKLDNIEVLADVTDTVNVTAAGALMDSEVTNLAQVKAFSSADYATAAQGTLAGTALQPTGDGSALTGMELSTASFKNTTGGQSVDGTTFVTLTDWADDGVDAVQYSAATGVITLTRAGTFLVSVTVAAESLLPTANYRWTGEVQLWKNGTTDVASTSGGYIRAAGGANETSFSLTKVLTFAASDTLAVRVRRITNTTGDATTIPSQCHLSFVEL
jgi:hypothetical protein